MMNMPDPDILIIGSGPAGLAAAIEARKAGVENLLVVERDERPGGILPQCIHSGFGLHIFGEELTGPEYIERFIEEAERLDIPIALNTMAMELKPEREVTIVGSRVGLAVLKPRAVILAMGCRERTDVASGMCGTRPAGIYTAGAAQRMLNLYGMMPGRDVVIVGSGDIGLIMARRLTLEGARVRCVIEKMPYPGGINRNIVQCLHDFDIPLYLSHTVVQIKGRDRVEAVVVRRTDSNSNDEEKEIPCDTVLISTGLIPENELSRMAGIEIDEATLGPFIDSNMQTSMSGVFACGDVAYVHNLVDWVTREAQIAGRAAARLVLEGEAPRGDIRVSKGAGVRMIVPHFLSSGTGGEDVVVSMRPTDVIRKALVSIKNERGEVIHRAKLRIVRPAEIFDVRIPREKLTGTREIVAEIANG